MEFSSLFRKELAAADLTQGQFADLVDVSQAFVSQVIAGSRPVPSRRLKDWADALRLHGRRRKHFFRAALTPDIPSRYLWDFPEITFGDILDGFCEFFEDEHKPLRCLDVLGITKDDLRDYCTGHKVPAFSDAVIIAERLRLSGRNRDLFLFLAQHPFPDSPGRESGTVENDIERVTAERDVALSELAALRAQLAAARTALGAPQPTTGDQLAADAAEIEGVLAYEHPEETEAQPGRDPAPARTPGGPHART